MSELVTEVAGNGKAQPDADQELIKTANALKDEGNALLSQGKFSHAAEKYSEAVALYPNAIYYANRAQALIKLESYGLAIQDANDALKLDPKYIKAYYRRGSANYALGKLKLALKDFKTVVTIVPKDPDALKKLKQCEKDIREEAFQKAIESEHQEEAPIDADSIVVEDSYSGPRLEVHPDTKEPILTSDFVLQVSEHFKNQKLLHRKYVIQILQAAIRYFSSLPSLLDLSLPRSSETNEITGSFKVCGDTHGQFYDLMNIFALGGNPSPTNFFLFNGDFVDRGSFSFETVFALLCWKLALPSSLHMLRGNHETKNMNKIYGFSGEIKHKYDDKIMGLFSKLFQALPLAATIEKKVFIVHGGLSTQEGGVKLSEIAKIDRFREPPESGLMSDLLWSDPQPQNGRAPSKRGLGYSFGPDYTQAFLQQNNLELVIRSHEVRDEGYEWEHKGKCVTVFSAPNYCDQMGNKGAFITFNEASMNPIFTQYEAVPHPDVPPMRYAGNVFSL